VIVGLLVSDAGGKDGVAYQVVMQGIMYLDWVEGITGAQCRGGALVERLEKKWQTD
jgi:hypothetical protein